MASPQKMRLGLALGSGSARGCAHIGVIRALQEHNIQPDIVCGSSIGALVGGFYVTDHLDELEQWLGELDSYNMLRYLDIGLLAGGGFIEGRRLIDFFHHEHIGDVKIESLTSHFAAVATDLATGEEVALKQGSLLEAVRASIALPGIFTPVKQTERWLVDGGLVNPVPISVCRAMGADKVIAVNLNSDITGKHLRNGNQSSKPNRFNSPQLNQWLAKLAEYRPATLEKFLNDTSPNQPGLFDVLASSINIMQNHITQTNYAKHPAELLLEPKLSHIGLLQFDRADEAIEVGYQCTMEALANGLEDLHFNES